MKKILILSSLILSFLVTGCSKNTVNKSIAVFVPGICDNSPTYDMLVQGVKQSVDKYNKNLDEAKKVNLFVMEAGTNQAEWGTKLTALAAEQKYDVIISSNPSLPDLIEPVLMQFPSQKYIILDAEREGLENMYTVCYNQYEAVYLTGYIGALMSKSHKMGLIAAQEYPVMNNILYPYFEKGAKAAVPESTVDFRVVGNWYDATKGAEITDSLYKNGVDVILPICGGASQGVINSAVNNKMYITWFDNNGFDKAPGTIISSTIMEQAVMSEEVTTQFLNGKTPWGKAKMVGIKEGYVTFVQDDPNYINTVPSDIREKLEALCSRIKNGELEIK